MVRLGTSQSSTAELKFGMKRHKGLATLGSAGCTMANAEVGEKKRKSTIRRNNNRIEVSLQGCLLSILAADLAQEGYLPAA